MSTNGKLRGPGSRKFRFKQHPVMGECDVAACTKKAASPRGYRCEKHKAQVRLAQLRANSRVWKERKRKGKTGHHIVYKRRGKRRLTEWATQNLQEARKRAIKGHSIVNGIGFLGAAKHTVALEQKKLRKRGVKPVPETPATAA